MKIIEFNNTTHNEWDEYVNKIPESTFLHTSWMLDYLNAINGKEKSKSFLILDNNDPIAVCPLSIHKTNNFGKEYTEASFGDTPCAYPAITNIAATQRRRMVRKIFETIELILRPYSIQRIEFYRHPVNLNFLNRNSDFSNNAEALSFGYLAYIKNTIIIDLRDKEHQLFYEMSQYQRKHIRKSEKQGLIVKEYRGDILELDKIFEDFKLAHFKSAGRLTRPIESWDLMRDLIKRNQATLFVASVSDGKDISYLYCGEFDKFCFGWSQVNIDEYERKYSPRHFLEWKAMVSYKKRGFYYYELGIKYDSPQINYIPTEKEKTISDFKERYGGKLYPCFYFEKFFNKDLFTMIYRDKLASFLASDYFSNSHKTDLHK